MVILIIDFNVLLQALISFFPFGLILFIKLMEMLLQEVQIIPQASNLIKQLLLSHLIAFTNCLFRQCLHLLFDPGHLHTLNIAFVVQLGLVKDLQQVDGRGAGQA